MEGLGSMHMAVAISDKFCAVVYWTEPVDVVVVVVVCVIIVSFAKNQSITDMDQVSVRRYNVSDRLDAGHWEYSIIVPNFGVSEELQRLVIDLFVIVLPRMSHPYNTTNFLLHVMTLQKFCPGTRCQIEHVRCHSYRVPLNGVVVIRQSQWN